MNTIFWHRRDYRLEDNAGLFKALKSGNTVYPVFIFDTNILSKLPKNDQRIIFIHQEITRLKIAYRALGSDLIVLVGKPTDLIPNLAKKLKVEIVFTNRDYEPYALERDRQIQEQLQAISCQFIGSKDHVIFEKNEILKNDGKPYTVFTPYARKWKEKITEYYLSSYPTESYLQNLAQWKEAEMITLKDLGFEDKQTVEFPQRDFPKERIQSYSQNRDIPGILGTSRLSIHLRFGTISIRKLAHFAWKRNETYLNELIWRDFYQMILFHFPASVYHAFKPVYDRIEWEQNEAQFEAWCHGKTGYPLVDAGMRELNSTGFMHNRVRMVVASFLTKHLLLDWRLGEAYFAQKLVDFEQASNIGGWQWAAGSGCDAAPYFRVFNPTNQQEKFDPDFVYIKKWIPEFGTHEYPQPIVEHKEARERCILRYKQALKE